MIARLHPQRTPSPDGEPYCPSPQTVVRDAPSSARPRQADEPWRRLSGHRLLMSLLICLGISVCHGATRPARASGPTTRPPDGLREQTPHVHALQNARIVTAPGQVIDRGTVVIRDGVIEAVGADVEAPADARLWNLENHTIHAGLIDAYGELAVSWENNQGASYWNGEIRPQLSAAAHYSPDEQLLGKLREQGITARLVAPANGIVKGSSVLVTTRDATPGETILRPSVAQHLRLTLDRRGGRSSYPNSPMGAVALARQAMYDALWYQQAQAAYQAGQASVRPEQNEALEVLREYPHSDRLILVNVANELSCLRAEEFAREFSLNVGLVGSGWEYRRLDAVRALRRPVIVPLDFPRPPNVASPEAVLDASLDDLLHWDHAPENPGRLDQAGVTIAFTTHGLRNPSDFLPAVRKAVERGLPPDRALRALTVAPAELFGLTDRLGTIAPGKLAHLVVCDGDLFAEKTKVVETWVDGVRFPVTAAPSLDVRGTWSTTLLLPDGSMEARWELTGSADRPRGTLHILGGKESPELEESADESSSDTKIKLSQVAFRGGRLNAAFPVEALGLEGIAQLSVVLSIPDEGPATWIGSIVWPDGRQRSSTATRRLPASDDKEDSAQDDSEEDDSEKDTPEKDDAQKDDAEQDVPSRSRSKTSTPAPMASFPVRFPLTAFGRLEVPEQPEGVMLTGATLWTCGPDGILENASILIGGGKILAVGTDLETPSGTMVIDARGKHITPGIIDCHSHMATDGGINESAQAITAEVRIADFIDCNDINIYRQLAGGVTAANILHGSANPIGGQNQVIKLRWGALPEQLKFAEAPDGIKFALGENVKQSNRATQGTRYPQSRMGVEQLIRDEFLAARQYRDEWADWRENRRGLPPRRDLELDAIVEILDGTRWIHCHSYRQDEILAMLRILQEFGVQIGTLQHILEGYKLADEMARQGAMGSSFSDWWAYKVEVYDAIPFNGALMHRAGVVVSFNSDDRELARHLNHEAAKAVKYGQVPPEEALKFVTLNPARQLRIDHLVGSLEPEKHADLVVWNGPPLSNFSRCEQTWIDGRKYFDLDEDRQQRDEMRTIRHTLVQKILQSGQKPREPGEGREDPSELWPRVDLFCGHCRAVEGAAR
jgi:imidazolonepropionase-like amidohydrolase